jgi:hypothetical protein
MTFDNIGNMARGVEHKVNGQMKHLSRRMRPYGERVARLSRDLRPYGERALELTRKHPGAALAGVFALGYLVARLGRRD